MTRNIIKYVGLTFVIIGIVLVMKNLFSSDTDWENSKSKDTTSKDGSYSATISLLDQDSETFLTDANLVVKDKDGNVVSGWTTDGGVHLVTNLKSGTYTLEEEKAPEGYHLNEDGVTFKIDGADEKVVMYNIAMTEEEIKYAEEERRLQNTTSSEVGVENTLSNKSWVIVLGAVASIILGIGLILFPRTQGKMSR